MSQALWHCNRVSSPANKRISERYLTRPDSMSYICKVLSVLHHIIHCADVHKDMDFSAP